MINAESPGSVRGQENEPTATRQVQSQVRQKPRGSDGASARPGSKGGPGEKGQPDQQRFGQGEEGEGTGRAWRASAKGEGHGEYKLRQPQGDLALKWRCRAEVSRSTPDTNK